MCGQSYLVAEDNDIVVLTEVRVDVFECAACRFDVEEVD